MQGGEEESRLMLTERGVCATGLWWGVGCVLGSCRSKQLWRASMQSRQKGGWCRRVGSEAQTRAQADSRDRQEARGG